MKKLMKKGLSLALVLTLCLGINVNGADLLGEEDFLENKIEAENPAEENPAEENQENQEEENSENQENKENPEENEEENQEENEEENPENGAPSDFDDPVIGTLPGDEKLDEAMTVVTFDLMSTSRASKEVSNIVSMTNTVSQDGKNLNEGANLDTSKPVQIQIDLSSIPVIGDIIIDETMYVKGGDTLDISYPETIKFSSTADIDVNALGEVIGMIKFDNTLKKATITFNSALDDLGLSGLSAKLSMEMLFDGDKINQGDKNVPIAILGKNYTYTVPEREIDITIEKIGEKDIANMKINWEIKVKAQYKDNQQAAPLKGYKFYDDLENVGDYVANSFEIGDVATIPTKSPDSSDKTLEYEFGEADQGEKTISFATYVADSEFTVDTLTKKNTAKIYKQDQEIAKDEEAVEIKKDKWIVKSYTTNAQNNEIIWEIVANGEGHSLKNVVITDEIKGGLTWKEATLQKDENSNGTWTLISTINVKPTNNEYSFNDISYPIKLIITTTANDTSHNTTYENQASISWEDDEGKGHEFSSKNVSFSYGTAFINKYATAHNKEENTINWKVDLVNIGTSHSGDLRAAELLIYGSEFDKNKTYQIENMTETSGAPYISGEAFKNLKPSYNQKYAGSFAQDSDHLKEYVYKLKDSNGSVIGDLIVVTNEKGGYLEGEHNHYFTYKTEITNPQIYASNNKTSVTNTVNLLNGDNLKGYDNASISIEPHIITKERIDRTDKEEYFGSAGTKLDIVNKDGAGYGSEFDYQDQSALYKISINPSGIKDLTNKSTAIDQENLGDITITEQLPTGWELKPFPDGQYFWLYEGRPTKDHKKVEATGFYNQNDTTFTSNIEQDKNKLELTFSKMKQSYILVIYAGPTGEKKKEYFGKISNYTAKNQASIKTNNEELGKSSIDTSIKSAPIHKTLDHSKAEKEGYLTWKVDYMPYDSDFENLYIEDKLQEGIELKLDSKGNLDKSDISVNYLKIAQNGIGSLGDNIDLLAEENKDIISYDNDTRLLKFQIPDSKESYRLSYKTDVAISKVAIKNKVTLKGGQINDVESGASYANAGNAASAAFKRSGWLEIIKNDETKTPLQGAKFVLKSIENDVTLRSGVTDKNGKLTLGIIPLGHYYIQEVEAPKGYNLDDTKYNVTVESGVNNIPNTVIAGEGANKTTIKNKKTDAYGNLKVSKIITGSAVEASKEFEFALELSQNGQPYEKSGLKYTKTFGNETQKGELSFKDSKATFTLKGSESIVINDIPKDLDYKITEKDYSQELYKEEYTNQEGTIKAGTTKEVSVTNQRNNENFGSLVISKTVLGKSGEKERDFNFEIQFFKQQLAAQNEKITLTKMGKEEEITLDDEGRYQFTLKDNENIRFDKFIKGWGYKVKEENYENLGYITLVKGDLEGQIQVGQQNDVAFENHRKGGGGGNQVKPPKNENPPISPWKEIIQNFPTLSDIFPFALPLEKTDLTAENSLITQVTPEQNIDISKEENNINQGEGKNSISNTDIEKINGSYEKEQQNNSSSVNKYSNIVQTSDKTPLKLLFALMLSSFAIALTIKTRRKKQ